MPLKYIKLLHTVIFSPIQNQYNEYTTFWLLIKKIPIRCKSVYWPVNKSSIYCPLSKCWPMHLLYWFNKSPDIDVTLSKHLPDSWLSRKRMIKTLNGYLSGKIEWENFRSMKVYNKTVIDWLFGQQQFCWPRMNLLPPACGFGQKFRSRVKQRFCCPRTQSITVYYCYENSNIRDPILELTHFK